MSDQDLLRLEWTGPDDSIESTELSSEEGDEEVRDEDFAEADFLRKRRAYIITQLYNVAQSIRTTESEVMTGQGLPEIPKRDLTPKDTVDESNPGSFLNAVDWDMGTSDGPGPKPLTDRAAERAGALLKFFDTDNDGCLSFDEFRAYLITLGRDRGWLGERLTTDREFWLQYVTDQAGSVAEGSGTTATDGKLTEAGFVGHRRQIEQEHPLEQDLLSVGLGILPEYLERWELAKEAFDRIDFEGVVAESEGKGRGEVDPAAGCSCKIERGEIQLLLADAGELMTKLRVEEELSLASRRAKLLYQVVEERRKRNRFASVQAFSRAAAYDAEKVYRSSWLSWFMSGREKETKQSWIESTLVRTKTRLVRGLRAFVSWVDIGKSLLQSLTQRGSISSALLMPLKESDSRATVRLAVGDVEDDGMGFSISFRFLHLGNSSMDYPVEQLPPGVGLSVTLDLEGNEEATEIDMENVTEVLGKVVRAHVLAELKRSPIFHSMRVSTVTLADKSRVVRVLLFWRPQANIDFICRQLKLGLRPTDLFRELTATFFCPITFSQILEEEKTVLNDSLMVSLTTEACFCGQLIAKLLEEGLSEVEQEIEQATADSAEHDWGRTKREARTVHTTPDMKNPLVPPKRRQGGANFTGNTINVGTVRVNDNGGGSFIGGSGAESAAVWRKTSAGRRRTELEKRYEAGKKRLWLNRMWSFAAKLRGTRAFAFDLEAATPLEALGSSWAQAFLPTAWKPILTEVFMTPGFAARWFRSWKTSLLSQASILEEKAQSHIQAKLVKKKAAQEKAVMMSETEEGKRLASLQAELVKLGVSSSLMNQAMGEKEDETTRRLEKAYDTQMEEYADLAEALRLSSRLLLGPREFRVQSGLNAAVIEIQGVDIFEALSSQQQDSDERDGHEEHQKDVDDCSSGDTVHC